VMKVFEAKCCDSLSRNSILFQKRVYYWSLSRPGKHATGTGPPHKAAPRNLARSNRPKSTSLSVHLWSLTCN